MKLHILSQTTNSNQLATASSFSYYYYYFNFYIFFSPALPKVEFADKAGIAMSEGAPTDET